MQADPEKATGLLLGWVQRHAEPRGVHWLEEKRSQIAAGAPDRTFFAAFSAAPRFTGKADLVLTEVDLRSAEAARAGWKPQGWSADRAARAALVLALPSTDADTHVRKLEQLFVTGDVAEQIALYGMLPLLPFPERYVPRAAEGLRSSMTPVFEAISLNNPFPADYFDEAAWNRMVLKAVFTDAAIQEIEGLDRRANPELARMLVDLVRERRAAGRTFPAQLWRLVGRFADEAVVSELGLALASDDPAQRQAAALALAEAGREELIPAELRAHVQGGSFSWSTLEQT